MPPDSALAQWTPSPNYWASRFGYSPLYIVMHGTDGQMPGCLSWLCSPESGASVHYLIGVNGSIYQLVSEDASAWANAPIEEGSRFYGLTSNPNWWTLSIEHERWDTNTTPITTQQAGASARLVADLRRRHGNLPLIPHSAICPINRPNCPGPNFPFDAISSIVVPPLPTITWTHFDGYPTRQPLVFYKDASFATPLYQSAATKATLLHFDGWRYGPAVLDPVTRTVDRRWYHRALVGVHEQGWVPSAWVQGNAANSTP